MGVPNGGCDDGKTSLHVDWDENSVNYTCFNPTTPFIPDENVESLLHCDNVPNNFLPSKALKHIIFYGIVFPSRKIFIFQNIIVCMKKSNIMNFYLLMAIIAPYGPNLENIGSFFCLVSIS